MKRRTFLTVAGGAVVALAGCAGGGSSQENQSAGDESIRRRSATLSFDVPAVDSGRIRRRYTCDGENVSPKLVVVEAATPIESLALVLDDPDAPGSNPYVHWTLWDLPPTVEEVPENVANEPRVTLTGIESDDEPPTVSQGQNTSETVGYTGPCPPENETHTYRFGLYGLSEPLGVEPGTEPQAVREALKGTVVGQTTYTGEYERGGGE